MEEGNKQEQVQETVTEDELAAIEAELNKANKSIVSEDIQKRIQEERESARREAEKEFQVNQRIKELEAEKETLKKQQEQKELEAARQLEELRQKVNSLVAARGVARETNPFKDEKPEPTKDTSFLNDEMADEIEKASFDAFMEMRSRD
jgi:chromosome segregation ATPase